MANYGGQLYEWNTDMDIDDKSIPYEQDTWGDLSASERFLKAFSDQFNEKNKYTDKVLDSGKNTGGFNINMGGGNDLAPGMSRIAPDIHVQQGYRQGDWTMPGTEGKKGFAGTLMRGVGSAFGPVGSIAGNVAAGATGADYW
jgi:hypothetical protein